MKKLKNKIHKKKAGFISNNRVVLAALAGALTGLAVTYLLETEKGRSLLSQAGNSIKGFLGDIELPSILKA
jgi:hypothetical protein